MYFVMNEIYSITLRAIRRFFLPTVQKNTLSMAGYFIWKEKLVILT